MRGMKGAIPFVLGLVIIIMVTVLFVLDKTVEYDERVTISSAAKYVYDTISASEELKRTTDSDLGFLATRMTSLGKQGGGFAEWTKESPTMDDLSEEYMDNVEDSLDKVSEIEEFRDMRVIWKGTKMDLNYDNDNFTISGRKQFTIMYEDRPRVKLEVDNNFHRVVDSSYFGVMRAGRNLFEGQEWKVDSSVIDDAKGTMGKECRDLTNETYQPVVEDFLKVAFQCGLEEWDGLASLQTYDADAVGIIVGNIEDELDMYLDNGYDFTVAASRSDLERTDTMLVRLTINVSIEDQGSLALYDRGFDSLVLEFATEYDFDVPKAAGPE